MGPIKKFRLQAAIAGLAMIESRYKTTGVIDHRAHNSQMCKIWAIMMGAPGEAPPPEEDMIWATTYFERYIYERFPQDFPYTREYMKDAYARSEQALKQRGLL